MYRFDVAVIGGGGAGLVAATAAAREGARVVLLHKTQAGYGTCTAYAGGGFTLACGEVTPSSHYQKTMETGRGMSQPELLGRLSRDGEAALREMAAWGVDIRISARGHASVSASAPSAVMGGGGMTRQLAEIARLAGVTFMENTVAHELHVDSGGVCGIWAVDWRAWRRFYIPAPRVILAGGGAGAIFARTDNPARVCGDSYYLALRAGARLRDMEFVQFYPLGWHEPGFPCWMIGLPVIDHVALTDHRGEPFLHNALRDWGLANGAEANLYARDRSARLIGERQLSGPVWLHLDQLNENGWQKPWLASLRRMYPGGVSPREYGPVRVGPVEHYFSGGVVIDENCRTDVEGLYCCGEASGGVDGASRIGGNALTNIVVFGLVAGREAAASLRTRAGAEKGGDPPGSGEGKAVRELRARLQQSVQTALGPVREGPRIKAALSELADIEEAARSMGFATGYEGLLALEMPAMLMSARAVAEAALIREESRGVHFRMDHNEEQAAWRRPVIIGYRDGALHAALSSGGGEHSGDQR